MAEKGAELIAGNSELFAGPLGNLRIGFKGYMLGKTTEDTQLVPDEDLKDILYSQDGTKASDHVTTGSLMMLNATFGKIKTELLKLLKSGFTSKVANPASEDDAGTFGRFIYKSHRDNRAGVLRLYAVDENGFALTDDEDVANFYEVVAIVNDNLINWGADTQRNLPVQFMIYYHEFGDDQVAGGPAGAFGYFGDPATEKVPAADWPDKVGPVIESATVTVGNVIDAVFDVNLAKQVPDNPSGIVAKVNDGVYKVATNILVSSKTLTITFPAASFSSGDDVELSISADVVEDTEVPANPFLGANDYPVDNPL